MALFNCRLVLVVSLLGLLVGHARVQALTPPTVSLLHSRTHLLVIYARINGKGPFKFILDTGSNITLIESSLFQELALKRVGRPSAKVIDWMALGDLAIANEISIEGGPSRKNIQVLEVDGIKRPDIDPSVRGVLGENFLSGFDVLIDNRRHVITFDSHNLLAPMLEGEHVALILTAAIRGAQVNNRPLVSARMRYLDGDRPLQLLLDTGSENIYLVSGEGTFPGNRPNATNSGRRMELLNGSSPCVSWKDRLQLGRTTTPKMKMMSCLKSPAAVSDNDGTLPTFLFKQLFIDHAHGYVIFNPIMLRKPGKQSEQSTVEIVK